MTEIKQLKDVDWSKEDWPSPLQRPPNKSGRIPYGYIVNPENDMEFIIDEEQVKNIEIAFQHLSDMTMSLREAADWLFVENKGRELTHAGLKHLWDRHKGHLDTKRKQRSKDLKYGVPKARQKAANYRRGRKIGALKVSMAAKQRKLEELEQKKKEKELRQQEKIGKDIESILYDFQKIPEEKEKIFEPNPGPQTDFLAATETQVLYGGSAGGEPKSRFTASFRSNASK